MQNRDQVGSLADQLKSLAEHFKCPILQTEMEDPVIAADNQTYERAAIEAWIEHRGARAVSPLTGEVLVHHELQSNFLLKKLIKEYQSKTPLRKLIKATERDIELAMKLREEELDDILKKQRNALVNIERERDAVVTQIGPMANEILRLKEENAKLRLSSPSLTATGFTVTAGSVESAAMPVVEQNILSPHLSRLTQLERQHDTLLQNYSANIIKRAIANQGIHRMLNTSHLHKPKTALLDQIEILKKTLTNQMMAEEQKTAQRIQLLETELSQQLERIKREIIASVEDDARVVQLTEERSRCRSKCDVNKQIIRSELSQTIDELKRAHEKALAQIMSELSHIESAQQLKKSSLTKRSERIATWTGVIEEQHVQLSSNLTLQKKQHQALVADITDFAAESNKKSYIIDEKLNANTKRLDRQSSPLALGIKTQLVLGAKIEQPAFERFAVAGDGECGYTAFGITRADAYRLITDNVVQVSGVLLPVVKESLLDERFIDYLKARKTIPTALITAYQAYQTAARKGGNMDKAIIDNLYRWADDLTVMQGYIDYDIRDKGVDAGWSHPRVLQALAHLQGITLYLWQLNERNAQLIPHSQEEYAVYNPDNATQRTDLLFINNNHFDRLQLHDRPAAQENPKKQATPMRVIAGFDAGLFSRAKTSHDKISAMSRYVNATKAVDPADVAALLKWVGEAHLENVEVLLKKNPKLALCQGNVAEICGHPMPNVTALQLAVWLLDDVMWGVILNYVDKTQAALQVDALKNDRKDITDKYGYHFNFDPLIKEYDIYIKNYGSWKDVQRKAQWEKVGEQQGMVPVWFICAFCERGADAAWAKRDFRKTVKREYDANYDTYKVKRGYNPNNVSCMRGTKESWIRGEWERANRCTFPYLIPPDLSYDPDPHYNMSEDRRERALVLQAEQSAAMLASYNLQASFFHLDLRNTKLLKSRQLELLDKLQASLSGALSVEKPLGLGMRK